MVSLTRIRSYLTQLLHFHEPPYRTALAFAIGAFIAFSPMYGLHTFLAVFCAWAFRLNFVALMAGVLINNPWTVAPILGATFWTGFKLIGFPQVPSMSWEELTLQTLYEHVIPYAWPFLVGGFVLSLLGAMLGYPAAYVVVSRYHVTRRHGESGKKRLPPSSILR